MRESKTPMLEGEADLHRMLVKACFMPMAQAEALKLRCNHRGREIPASTAWSCTSKHSAMPQWSTTIWAVVVRSAGDVDH